MAEYADLKISPKLRNVLEAAAKDTYGRDYRAISIAAHEAAIAYLILRAEPDVLSDALASEGFDDMDDLISYLTDTDSDDGRFRNEPAFDPLAALRTPRDLPSTEGTYPPGLYQIADTPRRAIPVLTEDPDADDRELLREALLDRGIDQIPK